MLRYAADVRSLAFVGIYFFLLWCGFTLGVDFSANLAAVGIFTCALCLFSFYTAVITHNTVHVPVFHNRWLNRLFQVALTLSYGHPVSMFVPGHNLSHHMYTQGPRDAIRTYKLRWRWNLVNVLLFTSTVTPSVLKSNLTFAGRMRRFNPTWFRQLLFETVWMVGFFAVLLVIDWKSFLVYVVVPHQFAQWGIVAINFPQHDGCVEGHPYNHSRNFVGRWTNWWTFNNGFHGMHHMRPDLHWSLLPEYHARELHPHVHPNLEEPSLLGWGIRNLIWPGRRLDYLGNPVELPELESDQDWVPESADALVKAARHLGAEGVRAA